MLLLRVQTNKKHKKKQKTKQHSKQKNKTKKHFFFKVFILCLFLLPSFSFLITMNQNTHFLLSLTSLLGRGANPSSSARASPSPAKIPIAGGTPHENQPNQARIMKSAKSSRALGHSNVSTPLRSRGPAGQPSGHRANTTYLHLAQHDRLMATFTCI